jgi:hypothetical protein
LRGLTLLPQPAGDSFEAEPSGAGFRPLN